MGKTGIIGAMDVEVETLKEAAELTSVSKIADMEFCEGTIGDRQVVIVKCGMGKVNAAICAQTLIREFKADRIINTGVAGSLDNDIDIGDFVVAVDASQHDYDVSPIGFRKGEIPYTGLYAFPADEDMRRCAVEAIRICRPQSKVFEGRICSGDQFICTLEQKQAISGEYGGLCCEMEGAAIAQVCYLNHIPYVIIRAVSDKVDGSDTMDFAEFSGTAAKTCASVVEYMIRN